MSSTDKFFSFLKNIIGVIGFVGIIIISAGVITRFMFKYSIAWTDELLRTIFIFGYFIGSAIALYSGTIMKLELAEQSFYERERYTALKLLKIVQNVLQIIFFGILTYSLIVIMVPFFKYGTTTTTSNTPAWLIPMGCNIGVVMMAALSIRELVAINKQKCSS